MTQSLWDESPTPVRVSKTYLLLELPTLPLYLLCSTHTELLGNSQTTLLVMPLSLYICCSLSLQYVPPSSLTFFLLDNFSIKTDFPAIIPHLQQWDFVLFSMFSRGKKSFTTIITTREHFLVV